MALSQSPKEYFPDGTPIDAWFYDTQVPTPAQLGTPYRLPEYGILPDGSLHTAGIQALIDTAARQGGGVIVVPPGIYRTGALFFRQGVHLYIEEGGVLLGSDDIADYPLVETRIEGECCRYFTALINADGLDGFVLCGSGIIDGNGLRSWKAFWQRRAWNPECTNKDEQRPRLVAISHCKNVLVAGLRLQNAHFWTNHLYKSQHVKYLNCRIYSPAGPVKAPSTDAIDIDACTDVLIKNCFMEVNDDAVVLKGGKGPWADTAPENGPNERILVEDCTYGFCHGCLTCGSESIHNRNILVRRVQVGHARNFLWLKMRPDTPQCYEFITVEDAHGSVESFVNINPWTQFFDLKDRTDRPLSVARDITLRRCSFACETAFDIAPCEEQYHLSGFRLEQLRLKAHRGLALPETVRGAQLCDLYVERLPGEANEPSHAGQPD